MKSFLISRSENCYPIFFLKVLLFTWRSSVHPELIFVWRCNPAFSLWITRCAINAYTSPSLYCPPLCHATLIHTTVPHTPSSISRSSLSVHQLYLYPGALHCLNVYRLMTSLSIWGGTCPHLICLPQKSPDSSWPFFLYKY